MEKEMASKLKFVFTRLKLIIVFTVFVITAVLIFIQAWSVAFRLGYSFSSLVYWAILLSWLLAIWQFRFGSSLTLSLAFFLFVVASLLTVFTFNQVGETIMKSSFIGWLVGLTQSLMEYIHRIRTRKDR